MTTIVSGVDIVRSIADVFQFISYYHPADYIRHLVQAYDSGESPAARDAIGQIPINSRMATLRKQPLWQDTATAAVFLKVGTDVRIDSRCGLDELFNKSVHLAYTDASNPLRPSIVSDLPVLS